MIRGRTKIERKQGVRKFEVTRGDGEEDEKRGRKVRRRREPEKPLRFPPMALAPKTRKKMKSIAKSLIILLLLLILF